jgi:hypothetical protein
MHVVGPCCYLSKALACLVPEKGFSLYEYARQYRDIEKGGVLRTF